MVVSRKYLKVKNDELFHKFIIDLYKIQNPICDNSKENFHTLARCKVDEFSDYCERKGVYYFSELPISKKVNDLILEYVETAMMAEQHIIDICIKKRQIPIIDRIRKNRSAKVFFTLYYDLEDWDFSSVFYSAYGEYYKELMKNETTTQLQNNLESDSDIASRLGFEESFKKIEKVVTKYIEDNKDCKMNVYKMK